jgi:hypothetical protein
MTGVRPRSAIAQTLPSRLVDCGTSVVAFDIYFFSFPAIHPQKSARHARNFLRTGNTTRVPVLATMGEYNIRFQCTNRLESILWAVIRRPAQQLLFTFIHFTSKYVYIYAYRVYAYLFFFIDKEIVCVQVQCVSACNDDNMSARPMGSRTCLIIRSYGNYLRTHTHTHTSTHSLQTGVRVHY